MLTIELYISSSQTAMATQVYRLSFTLKSWASSVWVVCLAFTWSKPLTFTHRKVFECTHLKFMVSGWSKQTNRHTHTCAQCSHTSMGLAQARSNYWCIYYIGSQTWPYNNYSCKTWVGGGRADPPTWVTATYSLKNNVHSNTKSVQLTDCLKRFKV